VVEAIATRHANDSNDSNDSNAPYLPNNIDSSAFCTWSRFSA
jgi:hypothetical protein